MQDLGFEYHVLQAFALVNLPRVSSSPGECVIEKRGKVNGHLHIIN